ncbi:extracellular calcium-sensing receptor-like [Antedon mediterranea]|uniref:extracellular calcium-sensing receptor-like n=1 Tax=Antedon mediterranea TaxID=105859 RepID=UPI003AF6D9C1
MLAAVDYVNEDVLQNITLGVVMFSDISLVRNDIEQLEGLCNTTNNLISLVVTMSSGITKSMMEISKAFHTPIIIDNHQEMFQDFNENVFYVGENWRSIISAILKLLSQFCWDWIGIIAPDTSDSRLFVSHVLSEAPMYNICSAFEVFMTGYVSEDQMSLKQTITDFAKVKVIISFLDIYHFKDIISLPSDETFFDLVWVIPKDRTNSVITPYIQGMGITREPHDQHEIGSQWYTGLESICNSSRDNQFGENTGNALACSKYIVTDFICNDLQSLHGNVQAKNRNVERAVEAIAHSLTSTLDDHQGSLTVNFIGSDGKQFYFDKNNYSPTNFILVNYQTEITEQQTNGVVRKFVGTYSETMSGSNELRINISETVFQNSEENIPVSTCHEPCKTGSYEIKQHHSRQCCTICLECENSIPFLNSSTGLIGCLECEPHQYFDVQLGRCESNIIDYLEWTDIGTYIGLILAFIGHLTTLVVMVIFIKYRVTPIVKASNYHLSMLLLFSLLLDFSLPFIHIGLPSYFKCLLAVALQGPSVTIALSIFLVKTHRVLTIFESRLPSLNKKWLMGHHLQFILVFILTLIEIVSVTVYLIYQPPYVVYIEEPNITYIQCQYTGVAIIAVYSYNWIIATLCFILSFRARHLPVNYNESRHMTITMAAYYTVWLTLLPPYLLLKGRLKTLLQLAVLVFAAYTLLLCLFMPKVYVIIFCPERNTIEESRRMTLVHTQRRSISYFESAASHKASVRSSASNPAIRTVSASFEISTEQQDNSTMRPTVMKQQDNSTMRSTVIRKDNSVSVDETNRSVEIITEPLKKENMRNRRNAVSENVVEIVRESSASSGGQIDQKLQISKASLNDQRNLVYEHVVEVVSESPASGDQINEENLRMSKASLSDRRNSVYEPVVGDVSESPASGDQINEENLRMSKASLSDRRNSVYEPVVGDVSESPASGDQLNENLRMSKASLSDRRNSVYEPVVGDVSEIPASGDQINEENLRMSKASLSYRHSSVSETDVESC